MVAERGAGACLADPNGPVDMPGAYNIVEATFHALAARSKLPSGKGMEWGEHHPCLFDGTERFFRAGYNASLIGAWLPALDGVVDKLRGARRSPTWLRTRREHHPDGDDLPGFGVRRLRLPRRVDRGGPQEGRSRRRLERRFEVADAAGYEGKDFDLIAFFDCLHDMGDPVNVARHARQAISDDGTAMIVEPSAGDQVQDNLNPVGRVMYGASTQICVPVSLARKVLRSARRPARPECAR